MVHLGISYSLLKKEIQTEKEQMQVLTLQDRMHLLFKMEIPDINISDFNSIITFGNELTPHALFIHSEKSRLLLNTSSDKAINLINQIIQKKRKNILPFPK